MNAQELIDWYLANKATLPQAEFELTEYMKVTDVAAFYKKIDKDISEYPEVFGRKRLIHHLTLLHQIVTGE